ncbi:MAG TPA: hypothetical protein PLS03_03075 [Terrimicrobiaceae bacterium]|nr:hypothetical protein [Terrimicrobiaceae bacterium]
MSDHSPAEPKPEFFDYKHVGGRFLGLVAIAVVAFGVVLYGAFTNKEQFAFSYLFAYFFFLTICMGGLFWTLVHHAVDAEWSVVVRRQLENMASLLIVMGVLFIPLVFVAPILWDWMQDKNANDPILVEKAAYLNKPFFWIRAVAYFAFFTLCAGLLRSFSIAQDKDGSPRYTVLNRRVTFSSALLFAVCLTFAAVDWLMGLDFKWFSTMWGVYIFAGTALSSMCVLVLIITALRSGGYLKNVVTLEHYHIMGKLMIAFTIFWAYIGFSQYMLIWYSNIPEETIYFLRRNTESWWAASQFMVVGHFFVPFLFLLFNRGKKTPMFLCGMACWILLMHMLDMYIIVLPALHKTGIAFNFLDLFSLIAIGCTLAAVFLKRLGDASLYPVRDPRLPQSIALKN